MSRDEVCRNTRTVLPEEPRLQRMHRCASKKGAGQLVVAVAIGVPCDLLNGRLAQELLQGVRVDGGFGDE